jgi:photosystem II stability/assembly factor-like uncharacterized protein
MRKLDFRACKVVTALVEASIVAVGFLLFTSCDPTGARVKSDAQSLKSATSGATRESPQELARVQLLSRTHWVVVDFNSIWKTENGGATWKRTFGPIMEKGGGDLSGGLSFANEQVGFAVLDHKTLGTVDGGNNWTFLNGVDFGARGIFFKDAMNGWAAGSEGPDDSVKSKRMLYTGKLWRTWDGGRNWVEQPLPKVYMDTEGDRWDLKDLCFSDPRNGWAVGNGVFLHTEDAGATWKELNIRGDFSRITFVNQDLGWAIHRGFGMFELTHDGGRTWKHIEMVVQTTEVRVLFVTPENGFAIEGSDSFLATTDGGENWRPVTLSNEVLIPLQTAAELYTYVGHARDGTLVALWLTGKPKGLLSIVSTDDGKSWK